MKENVNPVAKISHIPLGQILTLEASSKGIAVFTFNEFTLIPFVKASVSFTYNKVETDQGETWTTNLSANLKSELPDLKIGVLLVELESGEKLIIGDKYYPVKDISAPESILQKQIQITYKSWHKPLKIAI